MTDADQTTERIRQHALRLFCERGYGSTNVDDIATAAGIGVATLYRRWTDKAALANDIFARAIDDFETIYADPGEAARADEFMTLWLRLWEWATANPHEFLFVESHLDSAFLDDENQERKRHKDARSVATLAALELDVSLALARALVLGTLCELVRQGADVDADDLGRRLWSALHTGTG
ncbi:MAG: TetR/AcrR family transcriptional regulator [Actinomycetota bacterium]